MSNQNGNSGGFVDYLNFLTSWKRSEGPPRTWRIFEGRKKTKDDVIPKFSIQEVPEGMENEVIDFMEKYFITEEPICVDMNIKNDPVGVAELRKFWRDNLRQGISLVALMLNSDPTAKPVLVGVNILSVVTEEDKSKEEDPPSWRSANAVKLMSIVEKLDKEADVLKRFGVDKYLTAFGLSVHPTLRGQGIGEELIRTRDYICPAYQIPMTETMFTATVSQILAARNNFETLTEWDYCDIRDDEGKLIFPGVTSKSIKIMTKKFY